MNLFADRWDDFPDWIIGITAGIWEGRGIGPGLVETYGKDIVVRTPGGVAVGRPASEAATLATLAEFPARTLLAEDVIWSGDVATGRLSSHRILSQATHAGGAFAPEATGRRLTWRAFADCWAHEGQIQDEWLIRDNGAIVRQLGMEPRDWAAREVEAGRGGALTPARDVPGPYAGRGNENEWGARYADLLGRIMSAELSVIPASWDRACHLEYPGGATGHGWADADAFWLPLRAAFPSAAFEIHHVIGREDAGLPPRAAVRWSLTGRHDGWGAFGRPTGAEVHVMGICHAEFGPFRAGGHAPGEWSIRREWALFDETAVWKQILGWKR